MVEMRIKAAGVKLKVGFYDQSYLGLIFRKLLHVTPREYRRQCDGLADRKMS
jgi:AraC-like DNA-binding protein